MRVNILLSIHSVKTGEHPNGSPYAAALADTGQSESGTSPYEALGALVSKLMHELDDGDSLTIDSVLCVEPDHAG